MAVFSYLLAILIGGLLDGKSFRQKMRYRELYNKTTEPYIGFFGILRPILHVYCNAGDSNVDIESGESWRRHRVDRQLLPSPPNRRDDQRNGCETLLLICSGLGTSNLTISCDAKQPKANGENLLCSLPILLM